MSGVQRLETRRLVLRQPEPGDWPAFRDFMASDRAAAMGGPYPVGRSWRSFAAELGHWQMLGYGMWIVTLRGNDAPLGLIGPWTPADWPETEIGWMMFAADLEGTGIATEAARAAIAHAWDVLGWETIVSYIDADNVRSITLAEKLGAAPDPAAPQPFPDKTVVVYRHPRPDRDEDAGK